MNQRIIDKNSLRSSASVTQEGKEDGTLTNATLQAEKLNVLEKKVEELKTKTDKAVGKVRDVEDSINKSEKRINQTTSFLIFVASAVIITFFFASIPILYDYYRDNNGRYERYLKDVNELKVRMEILGN